MYLVSLYYTLTDFRSSSLFRSSPLPPLTTFIQLIDVPSISLYSPLHFRHHVLIIWLLFVLDKFAIYDAINLLFLEYVACFAELQSIIFLTIGLQFCYIRYYHFTDGLQLGRIYDYVYSCNDS